MKNEWLDDTLERFNSFCKNNFRVGKSRDSLYLNDFQVSLVKEMLASHPDSEQSITIRIKERNQGSTTLAIAWLFWKCRTLCQATNLYCCDLYSSVNQADKIALNLQSLDTVVLHNQKKGNCTYYFPATDSKFIITNDPLHTLGVRVNHAIYEGMNSIEWTYFRLFEKNLFWIFDHEI